MYLLVELYQLQLSFTLILCKWSTFLSGTVYSLHGSIRPGNCSFRLHTKRACFQLYCIVGTELQVRTLPRLGNNVLPYFLSCPKYCRK